MKNLIKCHYDYLINKVTIIILLIVLLIAFFGNIINVNSLNDQASYIENNELYFLSSFMVIRIVCIFVAVFIYTNSFLSKSDQYVYLICPSKIKRSTYMISKTIAILLLLLVFLWIMFFNLVIVGYLGYQRFHFKSQYLLGFLNLYLLMIFFGNLGLILGQLINNIYVIIIPFSVMNIGIIINENSHNHIYYIFNICFPNFINDSSIFVFGFVHVVILNILLYCVNMVIYIYKDL